MQPTLITLENFLSHKHSTLNLANRGLVLVTGQTHGYTSTNSNGAGKTSLVVDALLFVLFGKTARGAKGASLVNRQAGKDCLVTLVGTTDAGQPFKLERPQQHTEIPKARLLLGDTLYEGTEEVQLHINRTLLGGMGFDACMAAVVFGKGGMRYFTQIDDVERKRILEEIMSFTALSDFHVRARQKQKDIETALSSIEARQTIATTLLGNLQLKLQKTRQDHQELEQTAKNKKAKLKEELDAVNLAIESFEAVRVGSKNAHRTLVEPIARITKHIEKLEEKISTLAREIDLEESRLCFLKSERTASLEQMIESLEDTPFCPTCGRSSDEELVMQLQENLAVVAAKADEEVHTRTEALRPKKGQLLDLKADRENDKEKLAQMTGLFNLAVNQETKAVTKLESLGEKAVGLLFDQQHAMHEGLTTLSTQIHDLEEESKKVDDERKQLEKDAEEVRGLARYTDFWVDGFSNKGIKSLLMDSILPQLNERAQYYANLLTDGELELEFATQKELKSGEKRERFDVRVTTPQQGTSYQLVSDGQRRRADLIATLALGDLAASRVGHPIRLGILDEAFEGLDETGMERAVRLLEKMTEERNSIFVITHESNLAQYFPKVITVEHRDGISYVDGH